MGSYLEIAEKVEAKMEKQWKLQLEDPPPPTSPSLTLDQDPEVITEAKAILKRNPNFGWTWEQVLSGAAKIVEFERTHRC